MRQEVLACIHDGHFEELKSVLRAKSGMDPGVKNKFLICCSTCQTYRHRNPAQALRPVQLPAHAFQWVSIDIIILHDGVNYIVVVDAYSKWPAGFPLAVCHLRPSSPNWKEFLVTSTFRKL